MKTLAMPRMLLLTLCLMLVTACGPRTLTQDAITGTWVYDSRGDGNVTSKEIRSGRIQFRNDGTFAARDVSDVVTKISGMDTRSGNGTWSLEDSRVGFLSKFLDRPEITVVYEESAIPAAVYYSEEEGEELLTFAGAEEDGEWVKYRKVQ